MSQSVKVMSQSDSHVKVVCLLSMCKKSIGYLSVDQKSESLEVLSLLMSKSHKNCQILCQSVSKFFCGSDFCDGSAFFAETSSKSLLRNVRPNQIVIVICQLFVSFVSQSFCQFVVRKIVLSLVSLCQKFCREKQFVSYSSSGSTICLEQRIGSSITIQASFVN